MEKDKAFIQIKDSRKKEHKKNKVLAADIQLSQ